jgi:TonB family protein
VVLRFRLDPAGMTNNVDVVKVADEALGESAMQALQSAAPFPPMDDNNRCLTAKPIIGTFKVPSR